VVPADSLPALPHLFLANPTLDLSRRWEMKSRLDDELLVYLILKEMMSPPGGHFRN
jgi:hypothetical protein